MGRTGRESKALAGGKAVLAGVAGETVLVDKVCGCGAENISSEGSG